MDYREISDIRNGMRIDWDMPIKMDDGLVLRCDIYRPVADGQYPVIMTLGPYGKWLHFEDLYKSQWDRMCADQPDVPTNSTNRYQCWEVVDPEKWVPDGYVCIRVDSRGAGRSPGVIDIWSLREAQDLACCVEWAGTQPWSNGKVGLNGISYYAQNQWQTSALQPKHLAAICTWEGAADFYRDMAHHGGIFNRGFVQDWSKAQVYSVQNGRGTRGFKSRMNGDWVSGPETLSEQQLGRNRRDFYEDCISRKLDTDPYWQSRMPDWTKVKTPLLSSANWGGQGLHPRGNFEGFVRSASDQKWLEVHGIEHWTHFYTNYGVGLQKKFFGHFLKGEDTGWDKQPKVLLQVRHPGEKFVERHENEWPLARTQWTKFYVHPADMTLSTEPATVRRHCDLFRHGRRRDVPVRAARTGDRDHRPDRRKIVGVVGDRRCRPVSCGARLHAGSQRGDVPGRTRCPHADRPRVAALLPSQARPQADTAIPPLSYARRGAEADTWPGL